MPQPRAPSTAGSRMKGFMAAAWILGAIALRLYGANGADASIVGGLLFLVWTAPFGLVWQFWVYDYARLVMEPVLAQVVGDFMVISTGAIFWFVLLPVLRKQPATVGRPQNAP